MIPKHIKSRIQKKLYPVLGSASRHAQRALGSVIGPERAEDVRRRIRTAILKKRLKRSNQRDIDRLRKIGTKNSDLKLHFGCGPVILKGWINIDLVFESWKDYYAKDEYPASVQGNMDDLFMIDISETPLPLPDDSVSVVFHEDFIEHLTQRNTVLFLAETLRVLKPGGIHRIVTPDIAGSIKRNSIMGKGWAGISTREWDKHTHLNVLTPAYLTELAKLVGYSKVVFNTKNKSLSKETPPEQRPMSDRELHEQIFCDLIK